MGSFRDRAHEQLALRRRRDGGRVVPPARRAPERGVAREERGEGASPAPPGDVELAVDAAGAVPAEELHVRVLEVAVYADGEDDAAVLSQGLEAGVGHEEPVRFPRAVAGLVVVEDVDEHLDIRPVRRGVVRDGGVRGVACRCGAQVVVDVGVFPLRSVHKFQIRAEFFCGLRLESGVVQCTNYTRF